MDDLIAALARSGMVLMLFCVMFLTLAGTVKLLTMMF